MSTSTETSFATMLGVNAPEVQATSIEVAPDATVDALAAEIAGRADLYRYAQVPHTHVAVPD